MDDFKRLGPAAIYRRCMSHPHPWTRVFSNRIAALLVWCIYRFPRISPNHVTWFGAFIGAGAVYGLALVPTDSWTTRVGLVLLLEGYLVLDCTDGQLARLTRRFSLHGKFLDSTLDRLVHPMLMIAAGMHVTSETSNLNWMLLAGFCATAFLQLYPGVTIEQLGAPASSPADSVEPPSTVVSRVTRYFSGVQEIPWLSLAVLGGGVWLWILLYSAYYAAHLLRKLQRSTRVGV